MTDRDAFIILNYLPDIGPLRVQQLLNVLPSPQHILSAPQAELLRIPGIGPRLAETIGNWRSICNVEAEKEMAERAGAIIVTRDDPEYPPLLREIHDPPLCLYVRGDRNLLSNTNSIAIVGSRRTTHYGVQIAENLASACAFAGWTVVSGLARGIDTVAHETTVKSGGRTVAVIGSGLRRIYPQENLELARRICDNGAVISEFPMQFAPAKRTFPMRNRIISGMTQGTIVVEAGTRSGSLITAGQALDQNRLVFAVPGRVDSPQSRGCHALIKEGAKLVETFQDVLEEFSFLPGFATSSQTQNVRTQQAPAIKKTDLDLTLSESERTLLDSIGTEEMHVDQLVSVTRLPPGEVLRSLFTLEMRHLIQQLPGKRIVRRDHNHAVSA